jgi:hypothetical protein
VDLLAVNGAPVREERRASSHSEGAAMRNDLSQHYRRHARDSRNLAHDPDFPEARELLLQMARHWEALAEIHERLIGVSAEKVH